MEFKEAFAGMVKLSVQAFMPKGNTVCKVISVDRTNNTCDVEETGSNYKVPSVRLISVVDDYDKKFIIYPKVGSFVTIAYLWTVKNKAVIISYGETEEILLNGDEFGGLVKANNLVNRLNLIENKVNSLVTNYKAHVHPVAGASAGIITPTPLITSLTETEVSDIENEAVKHG